MVCALDPDPCVGAQGGEGPSALEVPGARLERIVSRQAEPRAHDKRSRLGFFGFSQNLDHIKLKFSVDY